MASSSSELHGSPTAPPHPDQIAVFYKLMNKKVMAGVLCREARLAELSAQAATQAEVLFGYDSLVVASLRLYESQTFTSLATDSSNALEEEALHRKSWALLLQVIDLLLRRLVDNTLLPGNIRQEELDYSAHVQIAVKKATNAPLPPPFVLRYMASTFGYLTLLIALYGSLNALQLPYLPAEQKRMVESFVLQGLDVIPQTDGIPANLITGEDNLVAFIEKHMSLRRHGPAFCAAVLRKWRSDAVSSVLRTRGVLETGIDNAKQSLATFKARQRADIAKHGLRDCALPSCSKTEKTVKEFAGCSGCRSVAYCCLEHQALDWRAHKKACKEKEAARLAEEEAYDKAADAEAEIARNLWLD